MKAYESVGREVLSTTLLEFLIAMTLRRLINNLYKWGIVISI
jgi:hypothetical protein